MQAEVLLHTQQAATPHASVQYWRVCQVEELYDLPFIILINPMVALSLYISTV